MTPRPPDTLDPFTRATRAHAEAIFAARAPDFAAMLARARELDPDVVSAASAAHAEALAPVIPIERGRDRDDEDALAPFTAAMRAELANQLRDASRPASRPAPPALPPPPRRRLALWTAGLAAVAAILLVAQAPQRMARMLARPAGVEALAGSDADTPRHTAAPLPRATTPPVPRDTPPAPQDTPPVPQDTSTPPVPQDTQPVPRDTLTPAAPPVPRDTLTPPVPRDTPIRPAPKDTRPPRPAAKDPPAAPVGSLEDEAQALWQRGELAAAEQKFREVVRAAGESPRAELAYGDLFALAGQIRGPAGQTALAREYLAAFPSGRFADDMRAGLCQRAAADARPACWRDYLERHPGGAHRRAADAALAGTSP